MIRRARRRPRTIVGVSFFGLLALLAGIGVLAGPIAFGVAITTSAAIVTSEGIQHHAR